MIDWNDPWVVTFLGLIPVSFVGALFYIIMRSIIRADSKERKVYSQIEAEERAKLAISDANKSNKDAAAAGKTSR